MPSLFIYFLSTHKFTPKRSACLFGCRLLISSTALFKLFTGQTCMCVCTNALFDLCERQWAQVLCVSEVKGEGLESLCFCQRSRWGYRRKYEEKDILPQLCINTCFHTRTLFWNNFSSLLLFDPSLSLLSVHWNGREDKREMKKWGGRQFLSFSPSLLSVFLPRTR